MSYCRPIAIEFCHCDPAGIVFYPRYVEMANSVIENFFHDEVGYPFARMMAAGQGLPMARFEVDFCKPSRLGERLEWLLELVHLGRSSARFHLTAEDRLEVFATVVWTEQHVSSPWPEMIRKELEKHHA